LACADHKGVSRRSDDDESDPFVALRRPKDFSRRCDSRSNAVGDEDPEHADTGIGGRECGTELSGGAAIPRGHEPCHGAAESARLSTTRLPGHQRRKQAPMSAGELGLAKAASMPLRNQRRVAEAESLPVYAT